MPNHPTRDDIDLLAGEFYTGDPHEAWTWMRANAPVYYDERNDVWALTTYATIMAASTDSEAFSNAMGIRPHAGYSNGSMIELDDPAHKHRRMLLSRGFTPRQVRDRAVLVREICDEIIDDVCEQGSCDFVWDIAARLPLILIGDMLGFERDSFDDLLRWSDEMVKSQTSTDPEALVRATAAFEEYQPFQRAAIAERRARPTDDLVSVLAHAEVDGEKLNDDDLLMELLLVLVGGDETTRHVISGGMKALFDNPDQLAMLQEDHGRLESGIEEMLRWVTPIKNMNRTATREVELEGQTIPGGAQVLLFYPSANRDETIFDDPFRFDVLRSPNNHLAFGFGSHFCLGNALARLELRTMFEQLFTRLPDLRLADDAPLPVRAANFISGFEGMPVEFTPAPLLA